MGKTLVVVESPGKISAVQSYVGNNYIVMASVGHIMDLPKTSLSVDVNNNFAPNYQQNDDKKKVIALLKSNMKLSSDILLATDKDREGEMIAWSIAYVLKLKNPKRLSFKSITKDELLKAIKAPDEINQNLVNAQKARRIMDRLLGYYWCPLLWQQIQPKISTGRVQSVVTRLMVDKEIEITNFLKNNSVPYFRFNGKFIAESNNITYKLTLHEIVKMDRFSCTLEPAKVYGLDMAQELMKDCMNSVYKITNILKTESSRNPGDPFTTSSLQQEASRKFGFKVKSTMMIAQNLYEAGLITYMRTDSVNLSKFALDEIEKYVKKEYGTQYYKRREYKSKSKNTQEAHEAVRPTTMKTSYINNMHNNNNKISNNEVKLYSLIWKRTISSQMQPALYDVTTIQMNISKNNLYLFQSVFNRLKFPGFLSVYNIKSSEVDEDDVDDISGNEAIPVIGTIMHPWEVNGTQEYSRPPVRYNEASLISKLDPKNLNIGRPATYADTINKIQKNNYIELKDLDGVKKESILLHWDGNSDKIKETKELVTLYSEKNKLVPTVLGTLVTNYLIDRFPVVMDYKFTAHMESKLDDIANGTVVWYDVLKNFYKEFYPIVQKIKLEKPLIKNQYEKILGTCPETHENVIATIGSYGPLVKLSDTEYKKGPICKPLTLETITLDQALKILEYPKIIGKLGRASVFLKRGIYGFYVDISGKRMSVPSSTITIDEVKNLLQNPSLNQTKILKQFNEGTKVYRIMQGESNKYIIILDTKNKKSKSTVSIKDDVNIDTLKLDNIKSIVSEYYDKKKKYKKPIKKE